MNVENLYILGTSHIAKQSVEEIAKYVMEENPDIIAVELDVQRAKALLEGNVVGSASFKDIKKIGFKGYLFVKIGHFVQQKLGKSVGVMPGSEMKTALLLGHKHNKKVALIDQPITITLRNFSKGLTWKERFRFVSDFFRGIFFKKKMMKEIGFSNWDFNKVPSQEIIEKMTNHIEKRYPSIYKALISDRNRYMVKKIKKMKELYPHKKILVVVGAGHKKGMLEILKKKEKN